MQVRTSEYEITEAMLTFGGGFIQQLARCIRASDERNKRTLIAAFPEYMTQYDEIAAGRLARDAAQEK